MKSLFLCAGEGTRFRPWTTILPKPALPCMNLPLAAYPTFWARELGHLEVCANTHHLGSLIQRTFQSPALADLNASFSDETGKLMGPAGGLKLAEKHLRGDGVFLVMNGDEVFLPDRDGFLIRALESHQKAKALCTIVVMEHPEAGTTFGAVWADTHGRVRGFGKSSPAPGLRPWHFIGAYFAHEAVIDLIPADRPTNIFYDILCNELERSFVQVQPVSGLWHETGNIADYLKTHAALFKTLEMDAKHPHRIFLEKMLASTRLESRLEKVGAGSVLRFAHDPLAKNIQVEGYLAIGSGSRIGEGSSLKNVVLGENVPAERVASPSAETLIL